MDKLFSQNSKSEDQSVLRITAQDSAHVQEQILNQIKPENSVQVQDQYQYSRPDQTKQEQCKLSILRSGVLMDGRFKIQIYSLLKKESPYDVIIAELEEGKVEIKQSTDVYRM